MQFVLFLDAAKHGNRAFDAGLLHDDLLKPTGQCGILLDIFSILIKRCRANTMQLAARKRRFQHVSRIHRTFRFASADHCVQLVDKQNNLPFLICEFVQQTFEPFLEFAAILRSRDQRPEVQRQQSLALESLGDLTVNNPLRKPVDNCGFADAGLTNQYRVVFCATLENLNRSSYLVISADDRVEFSLHCSFSNIDRIFIKRLALVFVGSIVHGLATAHLLDLLFQQLSCRASLAQYRTAPGFIIDCS